MSASTLVYPTFGSNHTSEKEGAKEVGIYKGLSEVTEMGGYLMEGYEPRQTFSFTMDVLG